MPEENQQETPPTGSTEKPATQPWGDDFDPNRAWNTIQTQREQEKQLKEKINQIESELQQRKDAEKTELEKAQERAKEAQERAEKAELSLLRGRVAAEFGIPADFLSANDEETLKSQAKALTEFVDSKVGKPAPDLPAKPKETLVPGNGTGGDDIQLTGAQIAEIVRNRQN